MAVLRCELSREDIWAKLEDMQGVLGMDTGEGTANQNE